MRRMSHLAFVAALLAAPVLAAPGPNATAEVPCMIRGQAEGRCPATATRGADQIAIDVTLPGGQRRALLFDPKGKFVTAATAQADGSAAYRISSRRRDDWTTILVGPETYRIPDAFILGD